MVTEEEKKELIEWVSGLTDPQTLHHLKIFKKTFEDKPFYRNEIPKTDRTGIDRDHLEELKDMNSRRIQFLKKFRKPVNDSL